MVNEGESGVNAPDSFFIGDTAMSESVVQSWLSALTWKQQTVLLAGFRGCDGKPKEDPSKKLARALRGTILRSAHAGYGRFMVQEFDFQDVMAVASDLDHYPMHWVMHFAHACEIVGYKHPDIKVRGQWLRTYLAIVSALHLNPETEEQLDNRLFDPARQQ